VRIGVGLPGPFGDGLLQFAQPRPGDLGVEFGGDGPGRQGQKLLRGGGHGSGCAGDESGLLGYCPGDDGQALMALLR
jgi:hypothetical protein